MRTKKHVSSVWLVLALTTSLVVFFFISIIPGLHAAQGEEKHISLIGDHFKSINADSLSTALNTRFESLSSDPACINNLSLNTASKKAEWDSVRVFLDQSFSTDAGDTELALRTLASDTPAATVISLCQFHQTLYALRATGGGNDFTGYDLVEVKNPATIVSPFILPRTRQVEMRTNVFEDDALFISAREGDASHTAWYYFKFTAEQSAIEQVEWCDRWFGGGLSPYGDDPNLTCEYTYKF